MNIYLDILNMMVPTHAHNTYQHTHVITSILIQIEANIYVQLDHTFITLFVYCVEIWVFVWYEHFKPIIKIKSVITSKKKTVYRLHSNY